MSTLWNSEVIDCLAERIRSNKKSWFWEDDGQGNPQPLVKDQILNIFKDFFPVIGIYNLLESNSRGVPELQPVFLYEHRVQQISPTQVETLTRTVLNAAGFSRIPETFHFKRSAIFSKNSLISLPLLPDMEPMRDEKYSSYRFFRNGYVKITSDQVTEAQPYNTLPRNVLIWHDQVIPRDYHPPAAEISENVDTHFRDFVENLSRTDDGDLDPYALERIKTVVGYMCHRFHNDSKRKAVILIDRQSDDNPMGKSNGGTGKSLLIRCLRSILSIHDISGKEFKKASYDKFALAGVQESHELVCFDDASDSFDFERIFPHITGAFHIRRARMDPTSIPADRAPKIVVTTNHPIKGSDTSHRRRQIVVEISPFYRKLLENDGTTPADLHGGMELCGDDWSDSDWCEFYRFIFECIQQYLRKGLPRGSFESQWYRRTRLINQYGSSQLLDEVLNILEEAADSGDEWFCEQLYQRIRQSFPNSPQQDTNFLSLLKDAAADFGYVFNAHKNGDIDKVRLSEDRWSRWNALGLSGISKKIGTPYEKDDRVSVFQITRSASDSTQLPPSDSAVHESLERSYRE